METVIPGLHVSSPEAVPFGPSLVIRAFLLEREQGNLLVYRAETLKDDEAAVSDLGGIFRQYLNHRHEAAPACDWVAETFGAPLFCHADDAESASAGCTVAQTFTERHRLDDDFEVIPTPGHNGSAASTSTCSSLPSRPPVGPITSSSNAPTPSAASKRSSSASAAAKMADAPMPSKSNREVLP